MAKRDFFTALFRDSEMRAFTKVVLDTKELLLY